MKEGLRYMERKLNVADFAAIVGTTTKTIYQKIANYGELPVNEQLLTVKEKVKGRETSLIVTNDEQIKYYKSLYGNKPVTTGKYYETLTEGDGIEPVNNLNNPFNNAQQPVKSNNSQYFDVNVWNEFVTVNNDFNERYEQKITELISVSNELAEAKGRQLLLEDKAGREGLYIKEINELKTDNNRKTHCIYALLTVIVLLVLGITAYVTYNIAVNNIKQPVNEQLQPEPVAVNNIRRR